MKFLKKKSKSFYSLLLCGLLISAVTPDRFTPQASAMATLFSVSWGAGSVAFKGISVGLATLASTLINRKKSSDSSNVTHFQQAGYTPRNEQKITYSSQTVGNDQVPQSQHSFDISQQENSLVNTLLETGRGLAIAGKSLSNMASSYRGQENLNSIPLITDCVGQEMGNLQVNNSTESRQHSWQTDQRDLFNIKDIQDLYQGVCSHQAEEYQKGLDQYHNQLTDAQQKRFQNRRDAFFEVYNNPDKTSQDTNTFSAKSKQLFDPVGINTRLLKGIFGDAFQNCIRGEQYKIADKLQEYSAQMPDGVERDFVTEYLTSNLKLADDYQ